MSYTSQERFDPRKDGPAASLAIAMHAAIFGFFLYTVTEAVPVPGPVGATLSTIAFGKDPAEGKPDAKENKPSHQTRKVAKAIDADDSSQTNKSDNDEQKPPKIVMAAIVASDPAAATSAKGANDGKDAISQDPNDAANAGGTVAIGVKATGTAGSPNSALAEAVSSAIANQIRGCWNPPITPETAATLNTDRRVVVAKFTKDGMIDGQPTVFLIHENQKSEVTQAGLLEEAAIDALKRCAPINLPAPLYPYWSQVELEFFPGVKIEHAPAKPA